MSHDAFGLTDRLEDLDPGLAGDLHFRQPILAREAVVPPCGITPFASHKGTWGEKLDSLWKLVSETPYKANKLPRPTTRTTPDSLRPENLDNTFRHSSDLLPRGATTHIPDKSVHTVGAVARFKYEPVRRHPFTGILASKSQGLIRVSNGNNTGRPPFAAGMALKFPISNKPSADMLLGARFARKTNGKWPEDADFLSADVRTWLDPIPLDPALRDLRTMFWVFSRMREQLQKVGPFGGLALAPDVLCQVNQEGTPVATPESPAGLVLKWSGTAKATYENSYRKKVDFRKRFLKLPKKGLPLAEVWALPEMGPEVRIGTLTTTSEFVASPFGDRKLFFRHAIEQPHPRVLPKLKP